MGAPAGGQQAGGCFEVAFPGPAEGTRAYLYTWGGRRPPSDLAACPHPRPHPTQPAKAPFSKPPLQEGRAPGLR